VNSGRVCYRIKQIDINGNYKFSEVVFIAGNQMRTSVSPNPARDYAIVYVEMENEVKANIELMEVNGKTIFQKKVLLYNGSNAINLPDLTPYRKGIYIIKLSAPERINYLKLVLH